MVRRLPGGCDQEPRHGRLDAFAALCGWRAGYVRSRAGPVGMPAHERGLGGLPRRLRRIYTGYLTCAVRAFPTNAGALLAFETAMYLMR